MPIKKKFRDNKEILRQINDAWLNVNLIGPNNTLIPLGEDKLSNPLDWPSSFEDEPYKYITWIMSQPEYFSFICSEILNLKVPPIQSVILKEMWNRKFPMLIGCRGFGKTFMLAVYCMLRILLMPRRNVVIAGAAFRQSKFIFEYMESIWYNAPILRDIVGSGGENGPHHTPDLYTFNIGQSKCMAIPIGDGSKIRGLRANDLVVDEFASVAKEIFEVVMQGFASVKSHPVEGVIAYASEQMARQLGVWDDDEDESGSNPFIKDNQIIVSGTADYEFKHFGAYWKEYRDIILTRGDRHKLEEILYKKAQAENKDYTGIDPAFKWDDYSIIRIPVGLIPPGFMDMAVISRAKATSHLGIFQMEYGACFAKDSNGFFQRSLIERCVIGPHNQIRDYDLFEADLYGNAKRQYIYGIDPASENNNFSIVVVELWPDHRRVVYCWTTNKEQHRAELKAGLVDELDFYAYCGKKIRWLMKRFPCSRIMIDSLGGGVAVMETLHDSDKYDRSLGEDALWPVLEDGKEKDTDFMTGLHIIEPVNFVSAEWTCEANHGMRKDMEDKVLLFPYFDAITLAKAQASDEMKPKAHLYDTLEDCVMEIEELKNELSIIVHTRTPAGRDHWDTPEVKMPGGKKGRLNKDRYSSLVMANMGARQMMRAMPLQLISDSGGGFAGRQKLDSAPGQRYKNNQEFDAWARSFYG